MLFGTWMCLYGLVHVAYRQSLPAIHYAVGVFYMLCGSFCLLSPCACFTNPWPMGAVFGLGELAGGNLNRHLKVLEEAEAIRIRKAFVQNKPQTTVSISRTGLSRFEDYLVALPLPGIVAAGKPIGPYSDWNARWWPISCCTPDPATPATSRQPRPRRALRAFSGSMLDACGLLPYLMDVKTAEHLGSSR